MIDPISQGTLLFFRKSEAGGNEDITISLTVQVSPSQADGGGPKIIKVIPKIISESAGKVVLDGEGADKVNNFGLVCGEAVIYSCVIRL